jgi:hypothetical protein
MGSTECGVCAGGYYNGSSCTGITRIQARWIFADSFDDSVANRDDYFAYARDVLSLPVSLTASVDAIQYSSESDFRSHSAHSRRVVAFS